MHLTKFNNTYLILLGVSLNTDSICQISFEKSELCMFEGESDFWVKFGTIERGRGGGGVHNVSHVTQCCFFIRRR